MTVVAEVGRAINPGLLRGQLEGGTAQGVGYGIREEVVMRDGAMANCQMTNYMMPTTLDTPRVDAIIMENPYVYGQFGAKGVDIGHRRSSDRSFGSGKAKSPAPSRIGRRKA